MHSSARSPAAARSESTISATLKVTVVIAALAAALAEQPDAFDGDSFVERLRHIVNRQRGDRCRDHRLHLDAGAGGCVRLGLHAQHAVAAPIEADGDAA